MVILTYIGVSIAVTIGLVIGVKLALREGNKVKDNDKGK